MGIDDIYAKPLVMDELMQSKALDPLPKEAISELEKIERLDVSGFYEQEVRSCIIDPIIRILGYDKGKDFSVDMGRPIEFLGKKKFPDYNFHLWQENFWLIEAKRPFPNENSFGYDALAQVIEYAVHPNINAALVVLCDGLKIEIFDREVSITEPILCVEKGNLRRDFDKIRRLLEPMQIWFFQKRRIVRQLDKVFDKEFNLQRVDEFRALIDRRLVGKRSAVLENFRRNVKPDHDERKAYLLAASVEELVDVHFFYEHSIPLTNTITNSLVNHCEPSTFKVLYKIFPDAPRDSNDIYMAQALAFLIALSEKRKTADWLPAWLAQGQMAPASLEKAVQYLLKQCLSYFEDDEARKIILLASAAMRRVFKLFLLSNEGQWRRGEIMHFLGRHHVNELSWNQIVSSPEGHLVGMLDSMTITATHSFVANCRSGRHEFKTEVGKLQLKELWEIEKGLLKSIGNYPQLCKERNLGDMRVTEASAITYDTLGHSTLCVLERFPEWTSYALQTHGDLIHAMASMNSWKARKLLELETGEHVAPLTDTILAARFFYGDVETLQTLRGGYSGLA